MDHWSVTVTGIIALASDVAPGPLITSHDDCSSEFFFFFYQNVFCLLVVSVCLKFIFHHFQSQCVLVYRARRGGGYVIKFKSLSKAFRKGRFFKFFLNWKSKFLINCTLKFVLTKHRAITAQSIKNRKVFPYTVY